MKNQNKYLIVFILLITIGITSCKKNDPVQEIDQEEVGTATILFTEVIENGDNYVEVEGGQVEKVSFSGADMLPKVGTHIHLNSGKTYRVSIQTTDFSGRESQQSFVDRADVHQAFILGAPAGTISYKYAEKENVGIDGFISVLKNYDKAFVMRYVMRHLNKGEKSKIKGEDWNNPDFNKFLGENDLDLRFEVHLVDGHHHH